MRIAMTVVWIIFSVLFALLGRYYHAQAFVQLPHIEIPVRPLQAEGSLVKVEISVAGAGLDEPLQEFARSFNEQIDSTNEASSRSSRLTAYGYYLAAFVALVSAVLEWREPLARLCR